MNRTNQHGFTLVEIAIVLVIIGLLLGGILKGQELITSARVRNLADQASGLQAAYYGFIDRYRQVPGDMQAGSTNPNDACNAIGTTAFPTCASVGGNGNGRIDDTPAAQAFTEASALWAQLSAAGFIPGAYQGGATSEPTYTPTNIAPVNAFNGRLILGRTADYQNTAASPPARINLTLGRFVPVNVMRELDIKIDDGQPRSGVLRAALTSGATFSAVNGSDTACVTTATPFIWDINANSADCNGIYLY